MRTVSRCNVDSSDWFQVKFIFLIKEKLPDGLLMNDRTLTINNLVYNTNM